MKMYVYRDHEIDQDGVTSVWSWECTNSECHDLGIGKGSALFWENTMRGARSHIAYRHAKESSR